MVAAVAAAVLLTSPAAEPSPARLATVFADEIARVAADRPLELAAIVDRTGRGAAFALDVQSLVLARLAGRVALTQSGPRLRVTAVLTETPQRLVVSARVLSEPGGELLDLLTASAATDPARLALVPAPSRAAPRSIDLVGSAQTTLLPETVLDLLLLPDERLAVLTTEAVSLYRPEGSSLPLEARQPLPGPLEVVRAPGGLLLAADGGLWALTSRAPDAVFFVLEERGRRIAERLRAGVLPWPGSEGGLRHRPGTNLLEGAVAGLSDGPFLAVRPDPKLAVRADGQLVWGEQRGPRVGSALAALWPDVIATTSPAPPGPEDAIVFYQRGSAEPRLLDSLPVTGTVRALAGGAKGASARLVAAVEEPMGTRLLFLDLRRAEP